MPTVDYEKIKHEQFKENVKKLKSKDVKDKIQSFSERSGYTVEDICRAPAGALQISARGDFQENRRG